MKSVALSHTGNEVAMSKKATFCSDSTFGHQLVQMAPFVWCSRVVPNPTANPASFVGEGGGVICHVLLQILREFNVFLQFG